MKPLRGTSYRALKAAGRRSLSERIGTARSISNSEIIDLGQRGLAIFVAALVGAVIWVDGTLTVVASFATHYLMNAWRIQMIAKYLATALLGTSLLAGAAMAQTSTTTTDKVDSATASTVSHQGQWRSSKLIGVDVYNEANEKLGDIAELIIDKNGNVKQVILGVGGFLGMGEKNVAVSFDKLKWVNEPVTTATNAPSTTKNPAGTTTTGTSTTTTTTTTPPVRSADEQWYPDHAVLAATKDQLKAMTQFKY
jgi:sporulation protein YlmC with PRC-barrel domain